ncbi:hypothetical protein DVA67_014505 [Solirubrobacter sp. CPCC 204708]|nr:hypothetical protein [Solirubrobacter deserti]
MTLPARHRGHAALRRRGEPGALGRLGIACYAEAVDRWLSDPAVPLPEHMRACFSELRAELS